MYLAFKINQNHIAETLCVNRYKPERLCSGKCILQQRLQVEDEKGRKEIPQKFKDRIEASYYWDELGFALENAADLPVEQKKIFTCLIPFTAAAVKGVFRPPNKRAAMLS